jgi:hypothetical protein
VLRRGRPWRPASTDYRLLAWQGQRFALSPITANGGDRLPERGFRFRKDPQFLAASLYLKKPERIMALLMVMTVCLLGYAALEYRIRQALQQ